MKKDGNPLNFCDIAGLLLPVAELMEKLHNKKVVHRNIKLANILRRKSDGAVILGI